MSEPAQGRGGTKAYLLAFQCPKCHAAPNQPCLNYRGAPKQACPARVDLVRPRRKRRAKGKLWVQKTFLPQEKGGES